MVKRIVVAGSRDYENYEEVKTYIEACIRELQKKNTLIFLSGGCRGVDMLGERYAKENGFPIERYPANWKKYGKSAGPKRNLQMVRICDGVICFWDGKSKGTASVIRYAKEFGKPLWVKQIFCETTEK
ncbi:MAG: DUF2493 domain-containing protein [Oscillospiraceae bacterium]|nr:DUF2493 domain-containing protein [Oscillospiraceae bacterium]